MTNPTSPLQILALQWRVMFENFVLAAKRFSRLERAGVCGAEARAEELEMQIRCALVVLARQIAEYRSDDLSPEDLRALEYLGVLMSSLLMLAMVAAKMRAELAEHSANAVTRAPWDVLQTMNCGMHYAYPTLRCAIQIGARGYLDSS